MRSFDLVTVGHFSIDFIRMKNSGSKPTLGGPPTFVSLAAKNLGAKVSVISKVGYDFPKEYYEWLIREGIDLSMLKIVKDALTTSYMLIYDHNGERRLILKARAPPINPDDIPESLSASVIHVSPIAHEVSCDVMKRLRRHADILSLDPQGILRRFCEDGRTCLGRLDEREILSKVDIFKASEREVEAATGESEMLRAIRRVHALGVSIVIVTRGERSTLLSLDGKIYQIPIFKSRVVDTTGAGDVFIGAFLAEYLKGDDPVWCSCVGSASASYVIEEVGPRGFKSRSDVYKRASQIYEGVSAGKGL